MSVDNESGHDDNFSDPEASLHLQEEAVMQNMSPTEEIKRKIRNLIYTKGTHSMESGVLEQRTKRTLASIDALKSPRAKRLRKPNLLRNLLWIAIYSISYIRGLFHEKYFSDKFIPTLEMKINKLMPMDTESKRIIDIMGKGVYDALQKKHLKTLLFCICEKEEGPMIEEYAFSFRYPNPSTEEITMNMSRTGSKNGSTGFKTNTAQVTPDQMRRFTHKVIRRLVSLMRTLDPMLEERTILMKLIYYDDVAAEDSEPTFFKCCADNETMNIWNKNPLKIELGHVKSKHLVLALKVKSVLNPSDEKNISGDDDDMSVDNESGHDDYFSDPEASLHLQEEAVMQNMLPTEEIKHKIRNLIYTKGTHSTESGVLGQKFKRTLASVDALKSPRAKRLRNTNLGSSTAGCIMCINPKPVLHFWNLDSGATNHISGGLSWIKNQREIPGDRLDYLLNAANLPVNLNVMGDILSKRLRLFNVYHSNDLEERELYISVGQLTDYGYHVQIVNGECTIHLPNNFNHIVGRGSFDSVTNAYLLSFFNDSVLERAGQHQSVQEEEDDDKYPVAEGDWALDSGSPYHCTTNISFLTKHWNLGNRKILDVAGKGQVVSNRQGHVDLPNLQVNNVYLCPHSRGNLISVRLLNAIGYNFFYFGDKCHITYRGEETLAGLAHKDGNKSYYVEFLYSKE